MPLSGTITAPNGEKINGLISFLPPGDQTGAAANAGIIAGQYQFTKETGPEPGPRQVIVTRTMTREESANAMRSGVEIKMRWELTAEVKAGETKCDLTLPP